VAKQSEFALRLAASGFCVFPCAPNSKLPAIKDFPNKATTDPAQVEAWWNGQPRNIGISTSHFAAGEALVVVDVDVKAKKRGDLSLLQLEMDGFELPETLEVQTPSGGKHLYYRTPKALRQGVDTLGPGIDTRSLGGYVLGPGSEIDGRVYEITHKAQIAPAPEWLVARLGQAKERSAASTEALVGVEPDRAAQRAAQWLAAYAPTATEGQGGDAETYQVALHLKDLGCSADQALDLMASLERALLSPMVSRGSWRQGSECFQVRKRPPGCRGARGGFSSSGGKTRRGRRHRGQNPSFSKIE
jgi:hypothetical protein